MYCGIKNIYFLHEKVLFIAIKPIERHSYDPTPLYHSSRKGLENVKYICIVEPLNKGHYGANNLVERSSLSRRSHDTLKYYIAWC